MKHLNSLLAGLAVVALASCTNEEPAPDNGAKPEGDVAYLNVTICPTEDGGLSRADENSFFVDGDEAENAVTSADFFFYDANGNYVLRANVWTGGNETPGVTNVEYIGNNVVVLEGLTGKEYPNWVVTVLNAPAGFTPGSTLDEMGKIVLDNVYDADYKLKSPAYLNETGKFIMTTSSHLCSDNKVSDTNWNYFATKLKANNFYQETPDKEDFADKDRVTIYVERLAARVGLEVNIKNTAQEVLKIGDRTLYRVDASVSGNPNDDISGSNQIGVGATKLYIEITGWDLITTARATKVMKDLSGWNLSSFAGWEWNRGNVSPAAYHRSYWGQATTYDKSGDALKVRLDQRKTYEELTHQVATAIFKGDRAYCNECTNRPQNITDNGTLTGIVDPTKTTAVILQAVVCNEKGEPVSLVNFQGLNYERTSFLNKVLANTTRLYIREYKGVSTTTGRELYNYVPVTAEYLTLAAAGQGTGTVNVVVKDDDLYYCTVDESTVVEEEYEYTKEDGTKVIETIKSYTATKVDDPNAILARITENNKAVAYTDGACYYPIAIAHLNQPDNNSESKEILEGQYGVVRNHIYNVRVTKIKTLGHGVFQPYTVGGDNAELIIPDPKDPTYYVESKVNILSWRVVTQEEEI